MPAEFKDYYQLRGVSAKVTDSRSKTAYGNQDDRLGAKLRGQDIQGVMLITLDEVLTPHSDTCAPPVYDLVDYPKTFNRF